MKSLCLLRHAKSSWNDPTLDDFDRPLNGRGRKSAPRVGRYLRKKKLRPELVLCSSARRARETWDGVVSELASKPPVKYYRSLYLASPARLFAVLRRCNDDAESLLLVGHNPGIAELASLLAGAGSKEKALASLREKLPTGALAVFELDLRKWSELAEGRGRLRAFVRPRDLD